MFLPDLDYFVRRLNIERPDVAHVEHAWGGESFWGEDSLHFEHLNLGLLCVSSRPSRWNRLLFRLMLWKNSRRWGRWFGGSLLVPLMTNRLVFKWSEAGCTDYAAGWCRYVHFTRPKARRVQDAFRVMNRERAERQKERRHEEQRRRQREMD
ncbi:unnamed protein product [Prorocentrum cordatum]|uniref:Uncharacterized protein n=1 Tax=Prorocentrum cordatum TaxID=2364126 RepID=A0ABN9WTL0_9DINO|nr:unnamed protein product [Polarella glacialis]